MSSIDKYPLTIRWLHRIIALCMIFMIALGWYLSETEYQSPTYNILRQLHRTVGILLLPLGIAHLLAYAILPRPALAAGMTRSEKALAKLVHMFLLYVVIAIPVAGYFMSGDHLILLGDVKIPAIIPLTKDLRSVFFEVHETLAWTAAAVIGLHLVAALKHHLLDKDDTLRKMM
ncbi:MAG TPA: cytochrome b [Pseudomonadales bacterium]|nr:cytochrome b [Pseudomonadales bacterium]